MNFLDKIDTSAQWDLLKALSLTGIVPDYLACLADLDGTIQRGLNGIAAVHMPYQEGVHERFNTLKEAMDIARRVAKQGTCPRRQVGAVFARHDGLVLATAANTAPPGQQTCEEAGCVIEKHDGDERCIRTLHAEIGCRMVLDNHGISAKGLMLISTCRPCHVCSRHVAAWGVRCVVHEGPPPEGWSRQVLEGAGVRIISL